MTQLKTIKIISQLIVHLAVSAPSHEILGGIYLTLMKQVKVCSGM